MLRPADAGTFLASLLSQMRPKATIDFETRSAISLKTVGSWAYSLHPSTQVLCLAFHLPTWPTERTSLWHPALPMLGLAETRNFDDVLELTEWIERGGLVEAHNAQFERGIWTNILRPRYGWPRIDPTQWRCSAAKAAAHALPRKLDGAAKALHLPDRKDPEGVKRMKDSAIKRMFKPRKPRKKEREAWAAAHGSAPHPLLWWESVEEMEALWAYCRQDVLVETGLSLALDDLSPDESLIYTLDQCINERGFQIDRHAVDAALALIAEESVALNTELGDLTNGQVRKATQRARMLAWFAAQGLDLPDTQGTTIDEYLHSQEEMTPAVRRALEIVYTLGRSSTAKYQSMLDHVCPDWRVRGGLLYHGATTGRWSGAGVQPHNFPKGTLINMDMGDLWTDLLTRDRALIGAKYGSVMAALAHGLRGAIIPRPGHQLYVADYASIEVRVLLWLADDEEHLEIFRQHGDMYLTMASKIYGYPCTKDQHPKERAVGKIAVLGLGYQMGAAKFQGTCENQAGVLITEAESQTTVDAYREEFWRVKNLWTTYERGAIDAVLEQTNVSVGQGVVWYPDGQFLCCELPSTRLLRYPFPEIHERMTPWGEPKMALTFMGVDTYTRQWERQQTYGGMLVENVTQAVARDIMAEAMLRCEQSDTYLPVLTVHDELVCEAPLGVGTVPAFESLVAECPDWAGGCPITAEAWNGLRYHK